MFHPSLLSASPADWFTCSIAFFCLGALLAAVEILRKNAGWSPEVTRKMIHVGTGVLVFFLPFYMESGLPALVLGIFFTLFNFVAIRFHWLEAIHGTDRQSYGTAYYPLAFSILVILCWQRDFLPLMTAMAALAFGDAAAGLTGQSVAHPHYYYISSDKKSLEGSAAMFAVSFLVIALSFYYFFGLTSATISTLLIFEISFSAALFATLMEAISPGGSDNLTIPLSVAGIVHVLTGEDPHFTRQFLIAMGLSAGVGFAANRLKLLNPSGAIGAFLLGTVMFGFGGWNWAFPILVFFFSSSMLSKLGIKQKAELEEIFEKGSRRDLGQVAANGGVAGGLILCHYIWPAPVWYGMFISCVAAVNADTWATEIGTYFKKQPRNILTWKKVEPGTSGGISLRGTLGGLTGAVVIGMTGLWQGGLTAERTGLAILAGMAGAFFDSFLGATVQAQFRCTECEKYTERPFHCGKETTLVKGWRWMNNDRVNFFAGLAGAIGFYLLS